MTNCPFLGDPVASWGEQWTRLPDGYSHIFRLYAFGASGLKDYGFATLQNWPTLAADRKRDRRRKPASYSASASREDQERGRGRMKFEGQFSCQHYDQIKLELPRDVEQDAGVEGLKTKRIGETRPLYKESAESSKPVEVGRSFCPYLVLSPLPTAQRT